MYGDVGAWIGLNSVYQSSLWEWVDNHPVTYTNWGQGEPNNYNVSFKFLHNPLKLVFYISCCVPYC